MNIGPRPKSRNYIYQLIVIGDHSNTTGRVPLFEQPDLLECHIWVIADIDYEQIGSVQRNRVPDEFMDGGSRSNDSKARRTQDAGKALPHQGTRPDKYRGNRPVLHDK